MFCSVVRCLSKSAFIMCSALLTPFNRSLFLQTERTLGRWVLYTVSIVFGELLLLTVVQKETDKGSKNCGGFSCAESFQIPCSVLSPGSCVLISDRSVTTVRSGWRRRLAAACSALMAAVPLPTTPPVPRRLESSCSQMNGPLWCMLPAVDTKAPLRSR